MTRPGGARAGSVGSAAGSAPLANSEGSEQRTARAFRKRIACSEYVSEEAPKMHIRHVGDGESTELQSAERDEDFYTPCPSYQPLKAGLAVRLIRRQRGQVLARHWTLVLAEQPRDGAEAPLRIDGGSRGNGGEVGHPARIVVVLRIVDNLLKRVASKHAQF
eukprot:scaffold107070_cov72-Phaeocystis_antarctica.AAC.4